LNATDIDNDQLTYSISWNNNELEGTLYFDGEELLPNQIITSPHLTFTPTSNTYGSVSFTYAAVDTSNATSQFSTVTISVQRVSYKTTADAVQLISSPAGNFTTVHLSGENLNSDGTLTIYLGSFTGTLYAAGNTVDPLSEGSEVASAVGSSVGADVVFYSNTPGIYSFSFYVTSSL
jgi:hypothetical protein